MFGMFKAKYKGNSTQAHETDERNVNICLGLRVATIQKEKRNIENLSIYKKQFYANLNICILKRNSRNQESIHRL